MFAVFGEADIGGVVLMRGEKVGGCFFWDTWVGTSTKKEFYHIDMFPSASSFQCFPTFCIDISTKVKKTPSNFNVSY